MVHYKFLIAEELRIVCELHNSHLSFGNVHLRINDYVTRKLPVTVNG